TRFSRDWSSDVCSSDLSGEQAAAERDRRRSTAIEPITPQEFSQATPTQGELFGGESTPFQPTEAPVAPSKPKVDLGPDLFPEAQIGRASSRYPWKIALI